MVGASTPLGLPKLGPSRKKEEGSRKGTERTTVYRISKGSNRLCSYGRGKINTCPRRNGVGRKEKKFVLPGKGKATLETERGYHLIHKGKKEDL